MATIMSPPQTRLQTFLKSGVPSINGTMLPDAQAAELVKKGFRSPPARAMPEELRTVRNGLAKLLGDLENRELDLRQGHAPGSKEWGKVEQNIKVRGALLEFLEVLTIVGNQPEAQKELVALYKEFIKLVNKNMGSRAVKDGELEAPMARVSALLHYPEKDGNGKSG